MSEIPQRRTARAAKLASLPLGVAGRATMGLGRRISGKSAEEVSAELQARTAEQLFAVLGELKGGAMKFGQALSVFEAALPEESAAPYREALTKLQEAAPAMPPATVHKVLDEQFGRSWPDRFREFDDVPAAAASIGQVHKAIWSDGRVVAVKLQYPGAGPALMADLTQLTRFARLFARLSPGLDVKPLLAELRSRVLEELDYTLEADAQRAFASAYTDDADIAVPRVVASAPKAMVSEWLDGLPLSRVIATGTGPERDQAGSLLALLHYSAPARAGLLHADPHPGNFRLLADGRLGVFELLEHLGERVLVFARPDVVLDHQPAHRGHADHPIPESVADDLLLVPGDEDRVDRDQADPLPERARVQHAGLAEPENRDVNG